MLKREKMIHLDAVCYCQMINKKILRSIIKRQRADKNPKKIHPSILNQFSHPRTKSSFKAFILYSKSVIYSKCKTKTKSLKTKSSTWILSFRTKIQIPQNIFLAPIVKFSSGLVMGLL